MRRFFALVLFVLFVALAPGCGSAPTVNTAPNDKQKQKEQGSAGPKGAGPNTK